MRNFLGYQKTCRGSIEISQLLGIRHSDAGQHAGAIPRRTQVRILLAKLTFVGVNETDLR